jgi:hypothetical protein
MSYYFLLTIDVEDWFQVENFKQYIPFSSWESYELRVEKNTHRILNLFDSIGSKKTEVRMQKTVSNNENQASRVQYSDNGQQSTDDGQDEKVRGTFFVLGWLAERLPHLVREIHSRGHEVASHGYYHNLCNDQSHEDLKADLCDSKSLLEDIIGNQVYGYRAPSFAINNDILKIIEDCGYLYDSSYNSFAMHGRYGHLDLSRNGQKGIALKSTSTKHQKPLPREIFTPLNSKTVQLGHDSDSEVYPVKSLPSETRSLFSNDKSHFTGAYLTGAKSKILYELPISNLKFAHQVFPWGGGGYFRLIPSKLFKIGIKYIYILRQENAYLFYFHPWEIDPEQPKVNQAPSFYKFRHYNNLSKTHRKLSKLIEDFAHCNFITCSQYLDKAINCAL